MKRFLVVFLVLVIVLAINFKAGILAQFSATNFFVAVLVALIISALVASEHAGFVVLVIGVALAANVPREVALSIGYDRDVMIALLVALVLLPIISRQF
ncbi:MAG: hypothetical protein HYR49_08765 [Gammaproteobacteria bacterium]|nr:hypothetical protein [Gammaproteobacteria bacterium]